MKTPPMELRDGIPVFMVTAERVPNRRCRLYTTTGVEVCRLVFTCPQCGRSNSHGGTWGNIGDGDGHRVSHCDCWPKGYFLREVRA